MASGRLTRYNQLISGLSPHYANVVVQPRGFPIFSDPLLKGQVRFARKTGADFSVINPDNEILLAEPAPPNTQILRLQRPNRWLEIGAIISMGTDDEFAVVKDFGDDYILLRHQIVGNFTQTNTANLFATPIYPVLGIEAGSTQLVIKSRYNILAGDRISVETVPNLLTSLLDIKISRARLLDVVDGDAPFNLYYEIILEEATTTDLGINSEALFLKAQPSYLSNQVFVPLVPNQSDDIGPFLLDYVSGVLFDRDAVDEQLSVTVFDKLGNVVIDENGFPLPVSKQFPITEMPVMGDSIVLWKVASGAMTFSKKGVETQELQAVALCDAKGQFQTTQEVIPSFYPGTEWHVPVTSTTAATLKVQFYPNPPREYELDPRKPTQVLVGTAADEEATTRIEIVVIGESDTQVEFGNWVPIKPQAFSLIYGITADVYGDAQWQATNLFQKPMFLNMAMGLKGRFDSSRAPNRFDSGMLFL